MKRIGTKVRQRRSISPIIAVLILLLVTIAASVLVYSYVMGFVGNSESEQGTMQPLSIEDFCVSPVSTECNSNGYYVVITNSGTSAISSGAIELYFSDSSKGTSAMASCQLSSPLNPESSVQCPSGTGNFLPAALNAVTGDFISLEVVTPDGSRGDSSAKVLYYQIGYVPITITNSQTSATPDNLQILINVDFDSYLGYLSSDVGNIRFFNSTNFVTADELPGWLENYTGGSGQANTATSSDVWIKLAGTIVPASSQVTIYMVFESSSTDFDKSYWGRRRSFP